MPWLLYIIIFVFWGDKSYHICVLIPFGADSWFGTQFSVSNALNLNNIIYLISSIAMLFNLFSVLESSGELKKKKSMGSISKMSDLIDLVL